MKLLCVWCGGFRKILRNIGVIYPKIFDQYKILCVFINVP